MPRRARDSDHPAVQNWEDVRRDFAIVGRKVPVLGYAERELVYLDHAATTHAPRSVLMRYMEFLETDYANVHRGTHLLSRNSTARFEDAYLTIAQFLGGDLDHGAVVYAQNTTHAVDIVSHVLDRVPGQVITTELEHHSNDLPYRRRGPVHRVRVTEDGSLDLEHLARLLREHPVKLVAVTAGSNVTGFMPDLDLIARLAHEHGAMILVDAAQALARIPLSVKAPGDPSHLDFVVGAGHKAYAPFGAGFVYGPRKVFMDAEPYLPGGGTATSVSDDRVEYLQAPDKHHGGTPNIAGVVGMAAALQMLEEIGREEVRRHELELMNALVEGLQAMGGVHLYGTLDTSRRLAVVPFNVEGAEHLLTAAILSEEGAVAVRNGRFCAHIYVDRLLSEAHGPDAPTGCVRASFGLYNDLSDVQRALEAIQVVRDRSWKGQYRVAGSEVSAVFAGRCADSWMEAVGPRA